MVELSVGSRVQVEKDKATVRYIGPVAPYKGDWLGIEWDDVTRGKHNGTLNDIIYFVPSRLVEPTSCSFVRANKVHSGRGLLAAVCARYMDMDTVLNENEHISCKQIQLVGMLKVAYKQNTLPKLRNVILDEEDVSHCGDDLNELATNLCKCELLDLSKNLLSDWKEIYKMLNALKQVTLVNLSDNKLLDIDKGDMKECEHIQSVILNNVQATANMLSDLSTIFVNVRHLGVCNNVIDCIQLQPHQLSHLVSIDLESNSISDWDLVKPLGYLVRLESLNLSRNRIQRVSFTESELSQSIFCKLKELYLRSCSIDDWESVSALGCLASLRHVVFNGCPLLLHLGFDTSRQIVIAKMRHLTRLDRQNVGHLGFEMEMEIDLQERRGAEIDYLKRFGADWMKVKDDTLLLQAFLQTHTTYELLIKLYGAPDQSEIESVARTGVLSDRLIDLLIRGDNTPKPISKKIPALMTVGKLKTLAARLVRLPPRDVQLLYEPVNKPGQQILLDNNLRQLQYFCMEPGDCVYACKI